MLSPTVSWTDIDPDEWANLWHFIYAPTRRPRRGIGILKHGEPLALVASDVGPVPLDVWPVGDGSLDSVADHLRRQLELDQVILVEQSVLANLWGEQQRFLDHEGDYDDYVLGIRYLTEITLRDHAICSPRELRLDDFPALPYEAIRSLVREAVGSEGAFLVTVFDGDRLWWSLAGLVLDDKIVRLTSSQGLTSPGTTLPPMPWREAHEELVDLCVAPLGPVRFALGLQLEVFDEMLRTDDLSSALNAAVESGRAALSRS